MRDVTIRLGSRGESLLHSLDSIGKAGCLYIWKGRRLGLGNWFAQIERISCIIYSLDGLGRDTVPCTLLSEPIDPKNSQKALVGNTFHIFQHHVMRRLEDTRCYEMGIKPREHPHCILRG